MMIPSLSRALLATGAIMLSFSMIIAALDGDIDWEPAVGVIILTAYHVFDIFTRRD